MTRSGVIAEEAGEEVAGASGVLLGRDRESRSFTRRRRTTRAEARCSLRRRDRQSACSRPHRSERYAGASRWSPRRALSRRSSLLQAPPAAAPCSAGWSPSRPPSGAHSRRRSGADAPAPDFPDRRGAELSRPGGGDAAPLAVEDGHWLDGLPPRCSSSWPGGSESESGTPALASARACRLVERRRPARAARCRARPVGVNALSTSARRRSRRSGRRILDEAEGNPLP